MYRLFGCFLGALALSGCGGLSLTGDPTDSSFVTPSASGAIGETLSSQRTAGSETSFLTGNRVAWEVGAVRDDGLQGFAGVVPGAVVDAVPATGQVVMNGSFETGVIGFILQSGTSVSGSSTTDRGAISLTADFDNRTLTGRGTGINSPFNVLLSGNEIVVDGTFSGSDLTGTVTYDGVSGPLRGFIGGNEAIGAFHGHTDNQVHAGGFIVN